MCSSPGCRKSYLCLLRQITSPFWASFCSTKIQGGQTQAPSSSNIPQLEASLTCPIKTTSDFKRGKELWSHILFFTLAKQLSVWELEGFLIPGPGKTTNDHHRAETRNIHITKCAILPPRWQYSYAHDVYVFQQCLLDVRTMGKEARTVTLRVQVWISTFLEKWWCK